MSPMMPTESISSDLNSKMDAMFSPAAEPGPSESTSETSTAPSIESAEYEYNPPTTTPTPIGDEATEADQAEAVDVPQGEEDDDIDLAKIEASGSKNVRVDLSRFKNLLQNHKMAQAIKEFAPSVEAAQDHYDRAIQLREMYTDLRSGEPERVDSFLKFWQQQAPEGFSQMTTRVLSMAPPEVQEQIRSSIMSQEIEQAYAAALETKDPNDLYMARSLDFRINGKWRSDEQLAAAPKPDLQAERERQLMERENALRDRDQKEAVNRWNTWSGGTQNVITQSLSSAITEALKPVAANYSPEVLRALYRDIQDKVIGKVKSDQNWMREYRLDYNAAQNAQTDDNRKALVDQYISKARPYIREVARPLLSQATKTAVAQNDQAHAQREASQNRRDITSTGRPSPTRVPPPNGKVGLEEKMNSFWQNLDRQAAAPRR